MSDPIEVTPAPAPSAHTDNKSALLETGLFNLDGSLAVEGPPTLRQPQPQVQQPLPQPLPQAPVDVTAALARALAGTASAPAESSPPAPDPSGADIPEQPPAAGDPKASHTWAGLRTRMKAAEAAVAEEKRQREALEAEKARIQDEFAAKYAEEQKRATELEEQIGRVSLENSPKFRERYNAEFGSLTGKLANTLVRYGGVDKDKALEQARDMLQADPKELVAMTRELGPGVGGAVIAISAEAQALFERRQMEIDQWREITATQAHDEAREGLVATVTQRRAMADAAIGAALESGIRVYDPATPELALHASKAIEEFRGFAQTATPDDLMRLAALGHAMPAYLDSLEWHSKRVAELESALSGLRYAGGVPAGPHTPAPSAPPAANPALEAISDPMDFAKAAVGNVLKGIFQPQNR